MQALEDPIPLYHVEEKFGIVSPPRDKEVVGMGNVFFATNLINYGIVKCLCRNLRKQTTLFKKHVLTVLLLSSVPILQSKKLNLKCTTKC